MKIMKKDLLIAITRIVDYMHDDELKSWEEWDGDSAASEMHIYNDVLLLKDYLKQNGINNKKG